MARPQAVQEEQQGPVVEWSLLAPGAGQEQEGWGQMAAQVGKGPRNQSYQPEGRSPECE